MNLNSISDGIGKRGWKVWKRLGPRDRSDATARELCRAFFAREPRSEDLDQWTRQLRTGVPLRDVIGHMQAASTVEELYQGIFNREPDPGGRVHYANELRAGRPLRDVLRKMLKSEEFHGAQIFRAIKQSDLPDITGELPRSYVTGKGLDNLVHHVISIENDSEFDLLEHLIIEHRFYDSFGGWGYAVDLDKRVIAAIVKGFGASSCLDIGCSNGPVISLLAQEGFDVTGIDFSHLAFALAFPNVRDRMRYGDVLSLDFDRKFDVILAMDFFEHLNPFKVMRHIERAASLLEPEGYLLVNSPMFGTDRVFGTPFPLHLEEWTHEPQDTFWRHIPCDAKGWPWDGHLIWAGVEYWERQFASAGLVRDVVIEAAIQESLKGFFEHFAPARRAIFVLRWPENARQSAEVAAGVRDAISGVDDLPVSR
jgi:SAM-dependent methyltransferase